MSARHHTLVLGLLAALAAAPVLAQDAATKALAEQGQYWQSRGDFARAAEAWNKLLRLQPRSAQALYGLARAELGAGRLDGAQRYLDQLRAAQPGDPLVARLEQELRLQRNAPQLQAAREQARAGQAGQAVASYQAALGSAPPSGPLALEYYQTLGSTPGGWEEARRGLQRLAQESPDDSRIALALAQHLTYREATRREGIAQLARLSTRADVGAAATESWRKALAWTGSRPADIPLYQAFLRAHPGDAAVQARLAEVERQQQQGRAAAAAGADPLRQRAAAGFKALDDGDLEAAEAAFAEVLAKRASDGDALGGMGVLRLRQEKFAEARDYLERASRQGAAARWKPALDSATYWRLVEQAGAARAGGDGDGALRLLEQAVRLNPREATAENDLADLLVEQGRYDAAEAAYRRVLARRADDPDAVRGLVGVLARNNKAEEALRLIERLSPQQQEKVGALGRLRATQALGQARLASERGDEAGARVALEDALLNDPGNPWVRLDLARLYLRLGATAEARGVMDGLLISNPQMPEALYASALLAAEAQDWRTALDLLERVPEKSRTRDIAGLHKRVWVQVQAATASALAREGRSQEALATLAAAEPFVGQDAELLGAVALAYTDAGDVPRAMALIQQVLARTPRPDTGLRLQYAAILLKSRQDVELAGILRQLQHVSMTPPQRRSYDELRRAYVVRQADGLRESGDLALAYDTLAPLLAERPDDPQAQGALARMYAANNDPAQALAIYSRLLEQDPRSVPLMLQAGAMATAARDYGYAESVLQVALAHAPRDPEVLTAVGRLYRAQGKNTRATEFFTAAVQAENEQRNRLLAARGAAAPRSNNPFAPRAVAAVGADGLVPPPAGAFAAQARSPALYVPQAPARPAAAPTAGLYIPDPAGASRFAPSPAGVAPAAPVSPSPALYYGEPRAAAAPPAITGTAAPRRGAALSPAAASTSPAVTPALPAVPAAGGYLPPPANPASPYGTAPAPAGAAAWGAAPSRAPATPVAVGGGAPAPGWGGAPAGPRTASEELRDIEQGRVTTFSVGMVARARQGEAGLSQLSDLQAPIQMKFGAGDGQLSVGLTPTVVDAGTPGTGYGSLSRFGGGPATALDLPAGSPGAQSSSGVGLQVGYESGGLRVDLGSTPLGFRRTDMTGGLRYKTPLNDDVSLRLDVSRRPVTDSALSFAGARDARTGETWGGVSATGGRLDLTWDNGEFGAYGYGALHTLTGTGVQSNSRAELGGGMYWHLQRTRDADLTAGLNFTGLSYRHNLRYFTAGHGGYFSPQRFLSMSVPVNWSQRSGRLSYQLSGSIGVQHFREDAAAYFPTNAARQASAVLAAADAQAFGETGATAVYAGQTKTGLGYNLGASMEYQLHSQVFVGGLLALNNAPNYREFTGGMYVRYALQPYGGPQALPVRPLRSPYAVD